MKIIFILAALAASRIGEAGIYPDKALTPGSVCQTGYPKRVRDVSAEKKALVYKRYGIPPTSKDHVIDHFIPLELGGSNEISNLWPQS